MIVHRILLPLLLATLISSATIAQHYIAIDATSLKDPMAFNTFQDKSSITTSTLADAELEIKTGAVKGVQIVNNAGALMALPPANGNGDGFDHYPLKGYTGHNDSISIMLTGNDGKTTYHVYLIITSGDKPPTAGPESDIPYLTHSTPDPTKDSPCDSLNFKNSFGEKPDKYDNHTIVYVYDFDEGMGKQRFYKITRKKDKSLNVEMTNLSHETLHAKSDPWLKLVNVNKFRNVIEFSDTVIDFESEPSLLFSRLFLGDSNLLGSLLTTFTNGLTATAQSKTNKTNTPKQILADSILYFLQIYNALQAKAISVYSPCAVFPCCDLLQTVDYRFLANRLLMIRFLSAGVSDSLKATKAQLQTETDALTQSRTARTKLDSLQKVIKDSAKGGTPKPSPTQQTLVDSLTKASKDSATHKTNVTNLTQIVKDNTPVDSLLAHLPNEVDLKKIVVLLDNIAQRNQQELYSLPVSGNALSIKLHIHSDDSVDKYFGLPAYNGPRLEYMIPIIGKPFVSFSSGSFIGFTSYLRNQTYTWQQLPDNTNTVRDTGNYILVANGYTLPAVGFSALGNVEWKLMPTFGLGFSGGVGLTIETTPRAAYLAGASIFLGNMRQFAITTGFAGMDINRLTVDWQTIADQHIEYTTKPTITYYKEFKVGGFISLTYTPFHISKH